jgi:hypothetical protein
MIENQGRVCLLLPRVTGGYSYAGLAAASRGGRERQSILRIRRRWCLPILGSNGFYALDAERSLGIAWGFY